jgi:surface protein
MDGMFQNCSSLTSLSLSNFNTENVTTMSGMFNGCSSLTSLDVSNFNTEKVANMVSMFQGCSSLIHLDISSFNGSALTTGCGSMFFGCVLLQEIIFPKKFITNKCTNIDTMFRNCPSLKYVDISDWDTSNVTTINQTFNGCSSLTSLDLSNWDTTNVTSYYQVFNGCTSLQTLDISNFNILSSVADTRTFITMCKNLVNIGMLYCNSETINTIVNQFGSTTTIWYHDTELEDLTEKENITYKEYKMNILESDEEINLRRIGDVYDELNLKTGELTQCIDEIILDGTYPIEIFSSSNDVYAIFTFNTKNKKYGSNYTSNWKTKSFTNSFLSTPTEEVIGHYGDTSTPNRMHITIL